MKKMSIIVPVYNTQIYLESCVDSILAQTINDIEIILVDDGSSDKCGVICDEYALKDSRIKVIHKENGGLSDARNAGIEIAEGKYVGFVDSDDFIHPNMYEIMLEYAEKENADIVQTEFRYFPDGLEPDQNEIECAAFPSVTELATERLKNFYTSKVVLHSTVCNKIYRREIFDIIRFPVGQYYEDSAILLWTIEKAKIITIIPERLYYYRQRTGSIMHSNYSPRWFQGTNNNSFNNLLFFRERKIREQENFALADYCTRFCKDKLAVALKYTGYKKEFRFIELSFRKELFNVLCCPAICKMKKIAVICLFFVPKFSYRICKRLFPECLYEFMR